MTDGMTEAGRAETIRQTEEIERIRLALSHLQLAINTLRVDGQRSMLEHCIRQMLQAAAGMLVELAAEIASRSKP